jgi:hypothetical protein
VAATAVEAHNTMTACTCETPYAPPTAEKQGCNAIGSTAEEQQGVPAPQPSSGGPTASLDLLLLSAPSPMRRPFSRP